MTASPSPDSFPFVYRNGTILTPDGKTMSAAQAKQFLSRKPIPHEEDQ